ncbi:MAG: hypothetical protein H0V39_01130 [Nitrosomonas sp.]|nr:hypothetical protein [Nitrosomonas sp.]
MIKVLLTYIRIEVVLVGLCLSLLGWAQSGENADIILKKDKLERIDLETEKREFNGLELIYSDKRILDRRVVVVY